MITVLQLSLPHPISSGPLSGSITLASEMKHCEFCAQRAWLAVIPFGIRLRHSDQSRVAQPSKLKHHLLRLEGIWNSSTEH
jgi:hypothetical protein